VSSGHLRRAGAQRIPEQWRHDLDGIEQEEESASFKAAENAGRRFYTMYSTCLFCHTTLGANEAVEHFPVGRRLAFDAAKGRLWVVCRKCERWNLTPIEERWEAIEECERSFRDTRLRVSTDQIGMSRLSEGLELVRIGKPLRPEFAAWRYGDQFGSRRRRKFLKVAAGVAGAAAIPLLGAAAGVSIGAGSYLVIRDGGSLLTSLYRHAHVIARARDNEGNVLPIREEEVDETIVLPPIADRPWGLRITHRVYDSAAHWWRYMERDDIQTDVRGDEAMRIAAQLLPRLNKTGASATELEEAIRLATRHADPSIMFERTSRFATRGTSLTSLPKAMLLAMEMASHEQSEKRALEGELHLLQDAWREAEEIASISDNMFLPTGVSKSLAEIKARVASKVPR
jgi:hypothetical protein